VRHYTYYSRTARANSKVPTLPVAVCVQLPTSAVNVILPVFAAERHAAALWCGATAAERRRPPPLSIDISCSDGIWQQTRHSCGQTTGQTDHEWMDARPFHRPCSAYYTNSVKNEIKLNHSNSE